MAEVVYNGNVVNSAISNISKFQKEFSTLSSSIKSATNQIVSARGFNEYIGGITSDTFSGSVEECGELVGNLIQSVREKQIAILSYSQDSSQINTFLDSLSRSEYDSLDLSSLNDYISFDRSAGNVLKGVGASAATFGLGLVEGVMDFGETACDLVTLGGTLFASIFTKGYDLITGNDVTTQMWNETKATVSEKKVESLFNNLYDNQLQGIKDNAYGFDTVRGISKGLGYTAGMIGTNVLTGGLASGLGVGAAGSVGAGQLAATAGIMGFSNGTEEAWADGATTGKGLLYGVASGAWEGTQWYLGAKINQYGGLGDKVASGIFKGAASGVGTRIAMDAADSGLEGIVQPALTMIYKDYGGSSFQENYAKAFDAAGGWGNVASQAAMGAFASAIGEFSGARKLLKEDAKQAEMEDARKVFASSLEGGEGAVAMLDGEVSAPAGVLAIDSTGSEQVFKNSDIGVHTLEDGRMFFGDADSGFDQALKGSDIEVPSKVSFMDGAGGDYVLGDSSIGEFYSAKEGADRIFASSQKEQLLLPGDVEISMGKRIVDGEMQDVTIKYHLNATDNVSAVREAAIEKYESGKLFKNVMSESQQDVIDRLEKECGVKITSIGDALIPESNLPVQSIIEIDGKKYYINGNLLEDGRVDGGAKHIWEQVKTTLATEDELQVDKVDEFFKQHNIDKTYEQIFESKDGDLKRMKGDIDNLITSAYKKENGISGNLTPEQRRSAFLDSGVYREKINLNNLRSNLELAGMDAGDLSKYSLDELKQLNGEATYRIYMEGLKKYDANQLAKDVIPAGTVLDKTGVPTWINVSDTAGKDYMMEIITRNSDEAKGEFGDVQVFHLMHKTEGALTMADSASQQGAKLVLDSMKTNKLQYNIMDQAIESQKALLPATYQEFQQMPNKSTVIQNIVDDLSNRGVNRVSVGSNAIIDPNYNQAARDSVERIMSNPDLSSKIENLLKLKYQGDEKKYTNGLAKLSKDLEKAFKGGS